MHFKLGTPFTWLVETFSQTGQDIVTGC